MGTESETQLGLHSVASFMDGVAAKQDLRDFTYVVKPDAKAGGYVGVLNRVTLTGKRRDGTDASVALIYKDQPSDEFRRKQFRTGEFFANEAAFYNLAIPAFDRLQDKKGLRDGERFVAFPQPFYAGEVVILEDLSPRGFKLADRKKPLDLAHCRLVMREMGRLHAFSFALRDQLPEEFALLKSAVKEILMVTPIEGMMDQWNNSAARVYNKYVEFGSADRKYAEAFKRCCDNSFQMMTDAVDPAKAEPYAVIGHGDCWTNNYLFKYAEESAVPEEVCMLDFQLTRYSSPACDLMYFLTCCTDRVIRMRHLDELFEVYHASLAGLLRKLGSDPEKLFPFSALKEQLRTFGCFGMGMAILALPLVADDPDDGRLDLDNLDEEKMGELGASENPVVWKRMADLVEDMVDLEFIL